MRKKTTIRPDLVLETPEHLIVPCIRQRKNHYAPLSAEACGVSPDQLQQEAVTLNIPSPVKLSRLNWDELHRSCLLLCTAHQSIQAPQPAAVLLLLLYLSQVMDLALPHQPGVPTIFITNATDIPSALKQITAVVCGPESFKGKNLHLKRPTCLQAVVPLGAVSPSGSMEDYLGGCCRLEWGGKAHFWLPLCRAAILSPNLPLSVRKQIMDFSPLMLPLTLGSGKGSGARPVFLLDGKQFEAYDPDRLSALRESSPIIQCQLAAFVGWMRAKKKRQRIWLEGSADFLPATRTGRFVQTCSDDNARILSAALSLFRQFLQFASAKAGWITADEAHHILLDYWQLALPESAPSDSADGTPLSWDSPAAFWRFLNEYIAESARSISTEGAPVSGGIVGALHRLASGESFLIFPRTLLLQAYMGWLSAKGGRTLEQVGRWEAQMQTAIQGWGVPLKREGEDISWRFTFYQSHQAPQGLKEKLPCLAFPLDQLPQEIIRSLESSLGAACSRWLPSVGQPEGGDAA